MEGGQLDRDLSGGAAQYRPRPGGRAQAGSVQGDHRGATGGVAPVVGEAALRRGACGGVHGRIRTCEGLRAGGTAAGTGGGTGAVRDTAGSARAGGLRDVHAFLGPAACAGDGSELVDLHDRVHSGAYRAMPSRRVKIPKGDGGIPPLGVAGIEDKIVQKAVVEVILTPFYEAEFPGFSYGFRPGRGAHDALDALWVGMEGKAG